MGNRESYKYKEEMYVCIYIYMYICFSVCMYVCVCMGWWSLAGHWVFFLFLPWRQLRGKGGYQASHYLSLSICTMGIMFPHLMEDEDDMRLPLSRL